MYTLKILRSEEFDRLPYKHAKTSLGLANAETGVAFVRDTGYNDVTKATISHELDEMVSSVSPHEEDGIRYKSLASLGAGAGAGALANMVPFLKPFSPLISAGAGALANRKGQPVRGALQGFAGGGLGQSVGSGLGGAIQGLTQPGGTFGKAFSSFLPSAGQGAMNYAGAIPGFGGIGTDQPTGALAKFFTPQGAQAATGGMRSLQQPINVAGGGQIIGASGGEGVNFGGPLALPAKGALQTAAETKKAGGGILDQFMKNLPGLLTAGAGDLLAPDVNVPDIAGVGERLKADIKSGEAGEPIAKELGMNELQRVLGQPLGEVPTTAFGLGDIENEEAKQKALTNYVNHFKAIRPGADFRNDPEFQRGYAEIEEQYDRVRAAQRDEKAFEYTQQQLTQKYNYMVQALSLDQYQMSQYIELAQLEVNQLMLEYGLSVEEAMQFKQMFGDLGQLMIQQQNSQGNDLTSILSQFGLGGQQNG